MTFAGKVNTVLLVRHAHTAMAGRFCGQSDPVLSSIGQQQLADITRQLSQWSFTAVYSSNLIRARRTADAIASSRHLDVAVRAGLSEIDFGDWEGKSWAEIEALNKADASRWLTGFPAHAAPNGEVFLDFRRRVETELRYLAHEAQDTCLVVVTHAGFIRTALVSGVGTPPADAWSLPLDYGSITELSYSGQTWHVK